MLYKDILEPMPVKRISRKKKPNNNTYIYYITRAYRNKHGNPTCDEVAIGKVDNKTGMLIPNKNYFVYFPDRIQVVFSPSSTQSPKAAPLTEATTSTRQKSSKLQIEQFKNSGLPKVLLQVAESTKLLEVLKRCFPTKWELILTIAFYMLDHSSTMMYIEDWFDEIKLDLVEGIDDYICSELFSSLPSQERQLFFKEWGKCRSEQEYIAFDVTSISTYSKNIEDAEWGYNRDNDKLPQVNCGMFYGLSSKMPVYYNMYSGSIPDKSSLEYTMINAKDIGIENACFVMDRGFDTKDNFSFMLEHQYHFITAMPQSRNEAKNLIDSVSGCIESVENWIGDYHVHAVCCPIQIDGNTIQAHVYHSNKRKDIETNEHYAYIEKLSLELESISKGKHVAKRYKDYFTINESSNDEFTYHLDPKKANEKLKRAGYFILLSSNPSLSSKDVLKIYRDRDVIEKHFDQLKNGLGFRRLKTHSQKTTEGKIFVGFISLILRSYMLNTLKNDPKLKRLTFEKMMIEIRKIKSVVLSNKQEALTHITSSQKAILAMYDVKTISLIS